MDSLQPYFSSGRPLLEPIPKPKHSHWGLGSFTGSRSQEDLFQAAARESDTTTTEKKFTTSEWSKQQSEQRTRSKSSK